MTGRTTVLVRAHPLEECFIDAVHRRALAARRAGGDTVIPIDLHADGHRGDGRLLPEHAATLAAASSLVLVYPTWWSAQPAILLDWILALQAGDLSHIDELVCVTTHGGRRLANIAIGRAGWHTAKRVLLPLCAPRASFRFVACYGLDRSDAADRERFLRRVERQLSR